MRDYSTKHWLDHRRSLTSPVQKPAAESASLYEAARRLLHWRNRPVYCTQPRPESHGMPSTAGRPPASASRPAFPPARPPCHAITPPPGPAVVGKKKSASTIRRASIQYCFPCMSSIDAQPNVRVCMCYVLCMSR